MYPQEDVVTVEVGKKQESGGVVVLSSVVFKEPVKPNWASNYQHHTFRHIVVSKKMHIIKQSHPNSVVFEMLPVLNVE